MASNDWYLSLVGINLITIARLSGFHMQVFVLTSDVFLLVKPASMGVGFVHVMDPTMISQVVQGKGPLL